MPSGGLKPNHMENYIKCECSALQLKERNLNGRKAKTNYYYPQKTHHTLKNKDTEELKIYMM